MAVVVDLPDGVSRRWPDGDTFDVGPSGALVIVDSCDTVIGAYPAGEWLKAHRAPDEAAELASVDTIHDTADAPQG